MRRGLAPGGTTPRGRVIAVIGGAQGIGQACAERLAALGALVAIGDRDEATARSTAERLGGRSLGLAADVTDPVSVTGFLDTVEAELGPVDVLVNSAGVMWVGAFDEEPDAATRRQLDVNLYGTINVVRQTTARMVTRRRGHVIAIASASSILPTPGEASYSASKHGVFGYLKAVRAELHGSGVQLSAIMPTVVDTALAAGTGTGAAAMLRPEDVAAAVEETLARPRLMVTVPRYVGTANALLGLFPEGARDAVMRRLVPNQVRLVNRTARAAYEQGVLDQAE